MYENQTEVAVACFDPNNLPDPLNGNFGTNTSQPQENGFSTHHDHNNNTNISISPPLSPIHHSQFHNNNNPQDQLDSSSNMGLEFSNPNNNINNDSNTINNNHHDPNNWTPQNIINVSHEMMGYQNFDEGIHSTTDLLTLLHLPRCTAFPTSSSTTLLPPPTPSISFAKSSTSPPPPPPPPPGLAFLGEMMNQGPMMLENGSSGFGSYDPASAVTLSYDPLFHLNLPPHSSPLLRDLMFQSLPHGFTTNGIQTRGVNGNNGNDGNGNGNGSSSLFGGMEDGEGNNNMGMGMNGISGIYQDGEHFIHPNSVFEFSKGASLDDGKLGKGPKNFVTERQRRKFFTDKYQTLRSLIPSPTKDDRASIVLDAINYINELKREVGEIKLLVERKRISNERVKRHKTEDDTACANGGEHKVNGVDGPVLVKPDPDEAFAGSTATQLRSSWLQRKYKDTEVDVRIVDDEVTIKLVQRKKINCLLSVSRTLDELQLDLRHVAGGHVGDYYSYLFNSKICEGSSVYASAIANKLIEVVERQYATASVAVAPTTSF